MFEMDYVNLLLTDDEFFKERIGLIDQNTFNFGSAREIVGVMKDAWIQDGLRLSPDVILMRIERKHEGRWELEEATEYLREVSERHLNQYRIDEIKKESKYFQLFKVFAYACNHAKDTIYSDGIGNYSKLKSAAERLVKDAEKVKEALDRLEPEGNGANDWS